MLYVYWGTDTNRTNDSINGVVKKLLERAPSASVERIDADSGILDIDSTLSSQGLFHTARIIVFDGVFANTEYKNEIFEKLEEIANAEHIFFIRETKLSVPEIRKIEKFSKKVTEFSVKEGIKESFNTFSLSDALLSGDKKKLWTNFWQAIYSGSSAEEIHGVLFWGAKTLMLAKITNSADEAGMKAYPYQKAQRAIPRFREGEIERLVADLSELPHEARRSGVELEYALEKFVLS